ncbi:MAG: hypothetical protein HKN33_16005 [Pyrinomonadaceae bacterium]|nr:hypothetical protein [Pyrinomonadaceae bacterium]
MRPKIFNVVFLIFALFWSVLGQSEIVKTSALSDEASGKTPFFPLNELREGLTGKAYTVFRGTEAEPFDVEILGLIPNNIGPGQDLIIGRISGGGADRTQVFAGMSGSPVYIDGKLVGAISYAFPFAKEAICGITPIEQMVSMFEDSAPAKKSKSSPKTYSFSELASNEWKPDYSEIYRARGTVSVAGGTGVALSSLEGMSLKPISTPLSFSGFSPKVIDAFTPELVRMGLVPVRGVSGSSSVKGMKKADKDTLVGGDSVTVELMRGDLSIAASGTVTLRDDDKIYAFGHPFLGIGSSQLPMAESKVVIVVPSMNNSFKLAVAESMVGSMTNDLSTGIYGKLGTAPKMIPVKLKIQTSRNKREELNFEIANDEILTPLLLNITVFNAISARERGLGSLTVSIDGKIRLTGNEPVEISGRYAGAASTRLAAGTAVLPAFNLITSKFDELNFEGIELDIKSFDESKTASLTSLSVSKSEVRPGESVEVKAFIRTDTGRTLSQTIPFEIPEDTPYGKLKLTVGDGATLQLSSPDQQFVPGSLSDLVATINKTRRNDLLYLQAKRLTTGAIIGSNELPNLPPSVLATLNTGRTTGVYKPTVETVVTEIPIKRSEFIVNGMQSVEIEIVD